MAKSSENSCTYRRAWVLNLRAWKLWAEKSPAYFVSTLLSAAGLALAPYVTIWLSARIIAELAGGRDARQLAFWAVLTVSATAVLALLNGLLKRWAAYEQTRLYPRMTQHLSDKMLGMDYAQMDRQEVYDLYSQIVQNDMWSGYGLAQTLGFFPDFCKAAAQILGGIGFTLTLFLTDVPAGSPLAVLNGPLALVGVLAAMVGAVLASTACVNASGLRMSRQAANMRLANRHFNFYGVMALERKRAADLRMYNQQEEVCHHYMQNNAFSRGGALARRAMGDVGLLRALAQALSAVLTGVVYLFVCLKSWAGAFDVGAVTQYVGAATQLFGGMRQRVMIAMALACKPKLLIADEPTTALDVTIQAQILKLMNDLKRQTGTSILFITHDLGVIHEMADEVAVMYCGQIVEKADAKEIFHKSVYSHPYTEGLMISIPRLNTPKGKKLDAIPGAVPNPLYLPKGCKFAPRCKYCTQKCLEEEPPLTEVGPNHLVRCFYAEKAVRQQNAK